MTEQKIDKRVARTKTRLKEGLADLRTRKSIQEITVKELVEYVHINRSTFYLHYSDISNMLENVKRELIEEIAEVMESYPPELFCTAGRGSCGGKVSDRTETSVSQ